MSKTAKALVAIITVLASTTCWMAVDKVQQMRGASSEEIRGNDHLPLPPPFKAAVNKIIQETLSQERTRNVSLYVTNGAVVVRAQTVVGVQSNQIVQLMQKAGL